ncbi:hypothetical protein [Metabacillus fastidiosus]|uniref:hypothetical protein n=1 Tax=Metabacillus fastidiosus TaxID=1458 RepID=UPI001470CAE0|nr:hypothetical protein [Metabacillus fastidiosus]
MKKIHIKYEKSYVRISISIVVISLFLINLFKDDIWDSNLKLLKNKILSEEVQNSEVNLSDFTPFEWDKVYFFPPYMLKEEIYKTVGYKWEWITETVSEGMNQIVFMKDDKVVCYIYGYPDNNGYGIFLASDFNNEVIVLYSKNNEIFNIEKKDGIVYLKQVNH